MNHNTAPPLRTSLHLDSRPARAGFVVLAVISALLSAGCRPHLEHQTSGPLIAFDYYYGSDCRLCREFLEDTVPRLEHRLGARLAVTPHDMLDDDALQAYGARMKRLGVTPVDLPSVIIGDTVLQGKARIDAGLEKEIKKALARQATDPEGENEIPHEGSPAARGGDAAAPARTAFGPGGLTFVTVVSAGLLDGINPCVFSTLIFLLAYLAYAGKTKRQILLIGIFYSVTVFISYFLLGLGIFKVLHAAAAFPVVAAIIEIVLVCALLVFAGLSLYDFILIKKGRAREIVLQLPDRFKNQIRKTIRAQAAAAAIIASAVILGFLVSVFELACTGQIYFPILSTLARTQTSLSNILHLLVYNLCFILPLVIVFVFTYRGLSSEKLSAFFQKHMAAVKLATVVLFLGLIAVVIFL